MAICIPTQDKPVQPYLPKEGWHNAEITEIIEYSQWEDTKGTQIRDPDSWAGPKEFKEKCKFVFRLEELDDKGRPIEVNHKPVNVTLKRDSNLRKLLDMIDPKILGIDPKTGKPHFAHFTPDVVIGRRCRAKVTYHLAPNGVTYGNIKAIVDLEEENEPKSPAQPEDEIPPFNRG